MLIMTIALHRLPPGFANGVLERGNALLLRCRRARHVENFFFQDRSVQIVHAITEGDLRKRQSKADPISGQVVDVIEVNPAYGEIAQLFKCRGALYVGEDPVGLGGFECEWNKSGKPAGFILQFT